MLLCYNEGMTGKKTKKSDVSPTRKDNLSRLAKSIAKKIKQKVLRRKRFLRVL